MSAPVEHRLDARVPVRHHVHPPSGYGAFSSSPDLAPEVVERLDRIVAPLAAVGSSEPARSFFPLGPWIAITSSANAGVDHAGRPRGLAHTILIDANVARALPRFQPAAVPSVRFAARTNAGALDLAAEIPVEELTLASRAERLEAAARDPAASGLLAALLARRGRTAVVGRRSRATELLGLLTALVPASRRIALAVLAGPAPVPEEACAGVVAVRVADEAAEAGLCSTWIDLENGAVRGEPLPVGTASYALSRLLATGELDACASLEAAFARWSAPAGRADDPPRRFARAFTILAPFLASDGTLAGGESAWPAVAAAIPDALDGGAAGLALELLARGFREAAGRRSIGLLREILLTLRESLATTPLPRAARELLAAEIANAMRTLAAAPAGLSAWEPAPTDAVHRLTGEARELLTVLLERSDPDGWPTRRNAGTR